MMTVVVVLLVLLLVLLILLLLFRVSVMMEGWVRMCVCSGAYIVVCNLVVIG